MSKAQTGITIGSITSPTSRRGSPHVPTTNQATLSTAGPSSERATTGLRRGLINAIPRIRAIKERYEGPWQRTPEAVEAFCQ